MKSQNSMRSRNAAGGEISGVSISHHSECLRTPAKLGQTRITLPLGGVASSIPEAVRESNVLTFGLVAAIAGLGFAAFVLVRLQFSY